MMQPIVFYTQMFEDNSKKCMERSKKKLLVLFEGLVSCNLIHLHDFPDTPKLYDSGVVYQPEFDTEEWQDIPTTLERGFGDCEDLAAYRCAELRFEGIPAKPWIRWRNVGGSWRFHALVAWPDYRDSNGRLVKGRVEDPSRRLGMAKWSGYLSATPQSQQF